MRISRPLFTILSVAACHAQNTPPKQQRQQEQYSWQQQQYSRYQQQKRQQQQQQPVERQNQQLGKNQLRQRHRQVPEQRQYEQQQVYPTLGQHRTFDTAQDLVVQRQRLEQQEKILIDQLKQIQQQQPRERHGSSASSHMGSSENGNTRLVMTQQGTRRHAKTNAREDRHLVDLLFVSPSYNPSETPSISPSRSPSLSGSPSSTPSLLPSTSPSDILSAIPSEAPSTSSPPSLVPSSSPSAMLSEIPSTLPSTVPSKSPSPSITSVPTNLPSQTPSQSPSRPLQSPDGVLYYGNTDVATGPWPECVGWEGEDCKTYILAVTTDHPRVLVRGTSYGLPDIHRVKVYTSATGVVMKIPERG